MGPKAPWHPGCLIRTILFPDHVKQNGEVVARTFKCQRDDVGLSLYACGTVIGTDKDIDAFLAVRSKPIASVNRLGLCHLLIGQIKELHLEPRDDPDPAVAAPYGGLHRLIECPDEGRREALAKYANMNGFIRRPVPAT